MPSSRRRTRRQAFFALIETGRGVANVDAIAGVSGVDGLRVGHVDLSRRPRHLRQMRNGARLRLGAAGRPRAHPPQVRCGPRWLSPDARSPQCDSPDGLAAVEAVCAKLLRKSIHSSDVILNIFARRRQPAASITIFADHLACLDLVILDELRSASRPRSSSPPILRSASGERVH